MAETTVGWGGSNRLDGRVAVVTGASSGIGAAVAEVLAGAGAVVVLAARREDRLRMLADGIRDRGGRVLFRTTDVTDLPAMEALVRMAHQEAGPVDILVNNAGIMPLSPLSQLRTGDWHRMVDVNVKGVLNGIAAVLPGMLERECGHIVNVGSVAGRRPFPGGAVYAATKFAVRALSAGIQLELSAAKGIRVTDVQPGVVETELLDHIPDAELARSFAEGWAPRRKLRPEDVAGAVLFAVTAPEHVNVNEILVRPTDQPT
ncbi:MAG: SDR family oxidoreductase [Longimicrobiales bacterium]|nr:SDR family oxidoreductase [Longimicrobiales bacterium]